jgi:hypothetical protein
MSIQEGEDAEEDTLLQIENVDENEGQLALLNGGFAELREQNNGPQQKKAKLGKYTVRFLDTPADLDDEDEDEDSEDDEEFNPDNFSLDEDASSGEEDSASSSSGSDLSSSDSDSSSDDESSGSSDSNELVATKSAAKLPNGVSGTSKLPNGIKPAQRAPIIEIPPGQGKNKTRLRNIRRKEATLLGKLKKLGLLPANANHDDLRRYQAAKRGSDQAQDQSVDVSLPLSDAVNTDTEMTNGGDEEPSFSLPDDIAAKMKESQNRLTALLQQSMALNQALQINGDEEEAPEELSSKPAESEDVPESDEPPAKRTRLDVRGAQRHIFGSLGVRTPKTAKDAEKTRVKLIEQTQPKKAAPTIDPSTATINWDDEDPESDAWRNQINLLAVECLQEGVTDLSEPPYPFYQRWDPQQQLYKGKAGKKRKNKGRNSWGKDAFDQSAEYEYYEDTTWLDYDEADAGAEGHNEAGEQVEDLPELPEDMSTLPFLTPSDLKVGATIAFKQLEMSQSTNWEPKISDYRTALVTEVPDTATNPPVTDISTSTNVIVLQMALRDRKQSTVRYDDQGNRIFEKFEMEGEDGEDDGVADDGVRVLTVMELRECKLVSAAEVDEEGEGHGGEGGVNGSGECRQDGASGGSGDGEGGGEGSEWVGIAD